MLARRRLPYLFVGWFWYVGMLVPVIGLVQVGLQAMADRYTYLPQIGLCIAPTWTAAAFGEKFLAAGENRRLPALGLRRGCRVADRGPCGMRVAADRILEKQRDDLDLYAGPHEEQRLRPQQSRGGVGEARRGRGGHRPFPAGDGPFADFRHVYANLAAALDASGQSEAAAPAQMKAEVSP